MRKTKAEIVQRIRDMIGLMTIQATKRMLKPHIALGGARLTSATILSEVIVDIEYPRDGILADWWLKHDLASAAMLAHELLGRVQAMPELTSCAADCDDMCDHPKCPQNRDGEPTKTGRHCPLHDPAWRDGDDL